MPSESEARDSTHAKKADFVIDNSGTLEETLAQVKKAWRKLLALGRAGANGWKDWRWDAGYKE